MKSRQLRSLAALLAIAALSLVAAGCGDDEETATTTEAATTSADTTTTTTSTTEAPAEPKPVEIDVTAGEPDGGLQDLDYDKGDQVLLKVTADAPEEVHVHGYDFSEEVGPDTPAKFDFTADIEGVFEIELENSAVQIAQLTVNP